MKLTTEEIQDIYYDLSTYPVERRRSSLFDPIKHTTYIFGDYEVRLLGSCVSVFKGNSYMDSCDTTSGNHPVFKIYEAALDKCEGRQFVNPYEKMSAELTVKKSAHKFEEVFTQNAKKIFPYDYRKDKGKYAQIINEMKQIFAQKIQEKCK